MLFNSFPFFIFFVVVTTIYFLLKGPGEKDLGWRWLWLLISSCFFYMWFIPKYVLILFLTITVDYIAAIYIENSQGKKRKIYFLVSVVTTCLILFFFKYFNFFNENLSYLAKELGLNYNETILNIILPVGLSFHTFQSLSYVIEVYKGNQRAEKHYGIFAVYVMFFPQLVAGPIERPQNLLHQFRENYSFEYTRIREGILQMGFGLFKKTVIADQLAVLVNKVYADPSQYGGVILLVATYFFAFQIYCDFSGYSDVARGSAKVLGFNLMQNFNVPYFSSSISEFWRRWHISLSTWFKDYFYIPLGGNKVSFFKRQSNLLLTFVVSGLWHGANWTYVAWGFTNGIYLVLGNILPRIKTKFKGIKLINIILTFNLICLTWIFFRATSMKDAFHIIEYIVRDFVALIVGLIISKKLVIEGFGVGLGQIYFISSFSLLLILLLVDYFQLKVDVIKKLIALPGLIRWTIYFIIFYAVVYSIFCPQGTNQEFIYFQF